MSKQSTIASGTFTVQVRRMPDTSGDVTEIGWTVNLTSEDDDAPAPAATEATDPSPPFTAKESSVGAKMAGAAAGAVVTALVDL